jgi:hypothetical protein
MTVEDGEAWVRVKNPTSDPVPVTGAVGGVIVPALVTNLWERGTVANVPAATETTVLTHTVSGSDAYLFEITATGSFDAEIRVYLNGAWKQSDRIERGHPSARFTFPGIKIVVGDVVDVKVIHQRAGGALEDYEATLVGGRP